MNKQFDNRGYVKARTCMKDGKACQHEGTKVCNGCSVFIGDGSKGNLFKGV